MKIKIILPNIENEINNSNDFEYSLGYIEVLSGKSRFSFFKNSYCMIFLTLYDLVEQIIRLKSKENDKIVWIGVDNGFGFKIKLIENNILFSGNDFELSLLLSEFEEALKKGFQVFQHKIKQKNSDILSKEYFSNLKTLLLSI